MSKLALSVLSLALVLGVSSVGFAARGNDGEAITKRIAALREAREMKQERPAYALTGQARAAEKADQPVYRIRGGRVLH